MRDPTTAFLERDQRRWIFPLRTPVVFAQTDAKALRQHIATKILDAKEPDGFVTGQLAYSRKDPHHLRRVFVLDPLSTFYLYDFVHSNRKRFPRSQKDGRHVYGHCFSGGKEINAFTDYHAFRRKKYELIAKYGYFAQVDIFNCFNSFYHHDVTAFVKDRTGPAGDGFGQFLREVNAGVSVACFPQGLYPAKVLGNAYLSLTDESRKLKMPGFARFLDDIVMAGDSHAAVEEQILELQYVLDRHHLALNDSKTLVGAKGQRFQERKLDRIRRNLVRKREISKSDYDEDAHDSAETALTERERKFLTELIRKKNVSQEDIELALALMRTEVDAVALVIDPVLDKAPHLLRGLHRFLRTTGDDDGCLWSAVEDRLTSGRTFPEHDLFWYARMLIDYFDFDQDVADLLIRIYEHPNASPVVKAAILETEYLEHGFVDLKETALRADGTLLISAAGMVGLAKLQKAKRNHIFKYVGRNSAHAALLVGIAGRMAG